MTRYYVDYPRGFANEYTVYAVASTDRERFERAFPEAEHISRARAVRLGWSRPREARRGGEQWYGGFCSQGFADTPDAAIEDCRIATQDAVEQAEMVRDAEAAFYA